jgi:APA family basic amino acid/polyamine antiporter
MKKLQRTLSLPGAIAVSIGGMLKWDFCSSWACCWYHRVFCLAWLFWFLRLCILPAVLSKSELATSMPKSGGTYVYIERAFGPLFGTISGLGLWLVFITKKCFFT